MIAALRFTDISDGRHVIWLHLFLCEYYMNSITRFGIWPIKKHFYAERLGVKEASRFHGFNRSWKVLPTQYNVDVLSISDRCFIDARYPSRYCISTCHSVRDAGLFQCTRGTHQ